MSVPAAFTGVIIIWSTTPLAIQWSGDEVGYLFGITSRMITGMLAGLLVAALFRVRLPWHADARCTYLAAGLGMFIAMLLVYRASRVIPSGWIAVIFGIAPMITGLMAHYWLPGKSLTITRVAGMLLGTCGIAIMLAGTRSIGPNATMGIVSMLISVTAYSASAVTVQRIGANIPPLATTIGGLVVTVILLCFTFALTGKPLPVEVPVRVAASIVYLGIIGSLLGFALYYYILGKMDATRVALITLITPVISLLLGELLNGETIRSGAWIGTAVILSGLMLFEYGHILNRLRSLPAGSNNS